MERQVHCWLGRYFWKRESSWVSPNTSNEWVRNLPEHSDCAPAQNTGSFPQNPAEPSGSVTWNSSHYSVFHRLSVLNSVDCANPKECWLPCTLSTDGCFRSGMLSANNLCSVFVDGTRVATRPDRWWLLLFSHWKMAWRFLWKTRREQLHEEKTHPPRNAVSVPRTQQTLCLHFKWSLRLSWDPWEVPTSRTLSNWKGTLLSSRVFTVDKHHLQTPRPSRKQAMTLLWQKGTPLLQRSTKVSLPYKCAALK